MGAIMEQASQESESGVQPLRLRFPARPENLRLIRRALERMELPGQLLEDAVLLTTELVTNSIRHADLGPGDHVDVTAAWSGTVLRVIVRDSGSGGLPADIVAGSIRPSPGGQSGWGLYLVDRLSTRWGTNLGGSVGFWFELEQSRRVGSNA
jgi:anti-sigma regulatory factor (Ser/Thr protein kinase)